MEDLRPVIVSIRCLTYNHVEYIRQCLDGFITQKTNFRFEAIVHDDCSTDGTTEIVREYAEKYPDIIKPIFEEENQFKQGGGRIRQVMNDACIGKYIAYCEGDDYWIDSLKLQKQVDFLESHPDYSMCFSRAKILLEIDSDIYLKCFDIENREYTASELYEKWIVPTASMLYRRSVIDYPMNGESRILNGDIVWVQKCAHSGKVRGMSDFLTVYRMQNTGVTYDKKRIKARNMRLPEHYECIADNFSLIGRSKVFAQIAEAYYCRSFIQDSKEKREYDLAKAEEFQPGICKKKKIEKQTFKIRRILKKCLNLK